MRRETDARALPCCAHHFFSVLVSQIRSFVLTRYEAKRSGVASELKVVILLTSVISIVFASGNYCTKLNNPSPLFDALVFVHVKNIMMNSTEYAKFAKDRKRDNTLY